MFAMEGLLGPVIAKLDPDKAQDKGIIAKVNLRLVPASYSTKINRACASSYKDHYSEGIVNNHLRNKLIVDIAKESTDKGLSVLIMVRELKHGDNIKKIARITGLKVKYIRGESDTDTRVKAAQLLNQKKIKCVIATSIWKEGISIPTLDHVINAFGGKGEVPTVQVPGRGTGSDQGRKESVIFTDFLDPYRYIAQHSIIRLSIYKKRGWLKH
jgi:superfamily II DNA or RNA helicase